MKTTYGLRCPTCGLGPINCTCPRRFRFVLSAVCDRCGLVAGSCTCKRGA